MRFSEVAAASASATSTRSRNAKTRVIADLLERADPSEVPIIATWMSGDLRQRRLGVGWATVYGRTDATPTHETQSPGSGPKQEPAESVPASVRGSASGSASADETNPPVEAAPETEGLSVLDVDRGFAALAEMRGEGSVGARRALLDQLEGRANPAEMQFLRSLLTGELRQGALAGVVLDAIALAYRVPGPAVRRAHLLLGDLGETARLASSGTDALEDVRLAVGRGLQPMLASTAASVEAAMEGLGAVSVEWKLDGARIQVHRDDTEVRIFTRNLNDITHRLPHVVEIVRALPIGSGVFDGEILGIDESGRPRSFQQTMQRFGADSGAEEMLDGGGDDEAPSGHSPLAPFFFDLLHVDGRDLLDEPLHVRHAELQRVAGSHRVPSVITDDLDEAKSMQAQALALGHEGVMVKAADSPYDAGRRGSAWRKVKPVRTFDLVVLAVEWGSGRREGWLSNLHLGALDPSSPSDDPRFVMVGKTFKGLTDALLVWQTSELLAREVRRSRSTVFVRPELVVEIAIDGVQHSTRYPGGVALRFARVKSYRSDKPAAQADTIQALQALLP